MRGGSRTPEETVAYIDDRRRALTPRAAAVGGEPGQAALMLIRLIDELTFYDDQIAALAAVGILLVEIEGKAADR